MLIQVFIVIYYKKDKQKEHK